MEMKDADGHDHCAFIVCSKGSIFQDMDGENILNNVGTNKMINRVWAINETATVV